MITVQLKEKFDTRAEAIHVIMCYVEQGSEQDFELKGRETKGAVFNVQEEYEIALKELGLETL